MCRANEGEEFFFFWYEGARYDERPILLWSTSSCRGVLKCLILCVGLLPIQLTVRRQGWFYLGAHACLSIVLAPYLSLEYDICDVFACRIILACRPPIGTASPPSAWLPARRHKAFQARFVMAMISVKCDVTPCDV